MLLGFWPKNQVALSLNQIYFLNWFLMRSRLHLELEWDSWIKIKRGQQLPTIFWRVLNLSKFWTSFMFQEITYVSENLHSSCSVILAEDLSCGSTPSSLEGSDGRHSNWVTFTQRWAQAALAIVAFLGLKWLQIFLLSLQKKNLTSYPHVHSCGFSFDLFVFWLNENGEGWRNRTKKKRKKEKKCIFVILLMIELFDLKEKIVCWSWRWWCCGRKKKTCFVDWSKQKEISFYKFIWW